jgi:hypothetical protein
MALLHESLAAAERIGLLVRRSQTLCWLAEACLDAGDLAAAEKHAREGLRCARAHHEQANEGWLLWLLARIAGRQGRAGATLRRSCHEDALRIARHLQLDTLRLQCERDLEPASGQGAAAEPPHPAPARPIVSYRTARGPAVG